MNVEMHKAIKLLNEHSLSVVSGNTQIKNGTIMVMDDLLGTYYTIHENGYARKRTICGNWRGRPTMFHYQLNKTRLTYEDRTFKAYPGKVYKIKHTHRILRPGEYVALAEMVVRAANRERVRADNK